MTEVERLLGAAAGTEVTRRVDLVVTDDWTTPALAEPLAALGTRRAAAPVVVVHDHTSAPERYTGADRERAETLLAERDAFVRRFGATLVAGLGIQHHVLATTGHLRPGMLVVGNDSHAPTLGAYGVLAFAGQPTTVAGVLHTGTLTLRVPHTVRVRLVGRLPADATARDAALTLLARLRHAHARRAVGAALEFTGPGVATLAPSERAVLANVVPEAVAATAVFSSPTGTFEPERLESGVELDLSGVRPHVARSGDPADAIPLTHLPRTRVDRVFVGTCAGGTFEEILAFAEALGDAAPVVPTLVVPATADVAERLASVGVTARLAAVGVTLHPPGCGFCFGFGGARLGPGEAAASTGNRNGRGRMGDRSAQVHLVSGRSAGLAARSGTVGASEADGEPSDVAGAGRGPTVVWPRRGNVVRLLGPITTDDITPSNVPGIGTSSDRDPRVLRRLLLHHVDAGAISRDLRGTVIVADDAFGAGSNRASSVRALQAAGVAAVVARSVAPLYAQGARDEGFAAVALAADDFYAAADPDAHVSVDLVAGVVTVAGRSFRVPCASEHEQALHVAGGVVALLVGAGAVRAEH